VERLLESKKYTEISDGLTFQDVLIELLNRKFIVIGVVILSLVCSFLYTKFFIKPEYVACAKLLITKNIDEHQQLNTVDFSISSYLIRDYTEIILDKRVLSRVSNELNISLNANQLKSAIKIENPSNSRVLEIYVTSKTPENAQKIANKVCEVSKEEILQIVKQDTVNIMSSAEIPKSPSNLNVSKNLLYGFIGGLILSIVVVSVVSVFDDTLKGKKDVRKYLGLEVLSVIPYVRPKDNSGKNIIRGRQNGRN
jgi:capsular polysaccharide biosynthesis protein